MIVHAEAGEHLDIAGVVVVIHLDADGPRVVLVGKQRPNPLQHLTVEPYPVCGAHPGLAGGRRRVRHDGRYQVAEVSVVSAQPLKERIGLVEVLDGQAVVERNTGRVQCRRDLEPAVGAEAQDNPVVLDNREVAVEQLVAGLPAGEVAAGRRRPIGQRGLAVGKGQGMLLRLQRVEPGQITASDKGSARIGAFEVLWKDGQARRFHASR